MSNEFKASVQYGDLKGTVSADERDRGGLFQLAQDHGIDTERYFVFGASYWMGENHGSGLPEPGITLWAFDTQVMGEDYDKIHQYLLSHQSESVVYHRFDLKLTTDQFLDTFKRFHVTMLRDELIPEGMDFKAVDHDGGDEEEE